MNINEDGINTICFIANDPDQFKSYRVTLNDGDEITIIVTQARGVILIRDALNIKNQARMNAMSLLELLYIYSEAIKDEVLFPAKIITCNHLTA